jgi:hypothetical protein
MLLVTGHSLASSTVLAQVRVISQMFATAETVAGKLHGLRRTCTSTALHPGHDMVHRAR